MRKVVNTRFLPYERFEITTSLTPEEVEWRLRENTEPRKWFGFFSGKIYEGEIEENSFKIRERGLFRLFGIGYPIINGKIDYINRRSRIRITIRASNPSIALLMVFGIIYCILYFSLKDIIIPSYGIYPPAFLPIILILLTYVGVWAQFWYDVERLKKELHGIFEESIS